MKNEFMFCPKCGKGEQAANSYCRGCGILLPDLAKDTGKKKMLSFGGDTPEQQIKTSLYLNLLTALVSLALGIALVLSFLGRDAPPLIYLTGAFLLAMSGWQFSTCFINLKLRKIFNRRQDASWTVNQTRAETEIKSAKTKELLNEPDLTNVVPPSVTEHTTRTLDKIPRR